MLHSKKYIIIDHDKNDNKSKYHSYYPSLTAILQVSEHFVFNSILYLAMNWSGAVRYSMDQENKVNKKFTLSLGNLTELESIPQSQALCTLYRLLNQPMYVVPERCNNWLFTYACCFPNMHGWSREITQKGIFFDRLTVTYLCSCVLFLMSKTKDWETTT